MNPYAPLARALRWLACALLALALPAGAQTKLWLQHDAETPVLLAEPADSIDVSGTGSEIIVQADGLWIRLAPAPGGVLGAGPYERATANLPTNSPGLIVSGDFDCSDFPGRFVVLAIEYDTEGNVVSLAADLESRCWEGAQATWGEIRFNSAWPLTVEKSAGWTQPDQFVFDARGQLQPSTQVTSWESTVYGINAPAPITVVDGEYSVNGSAFTALPGTVNNRDRIRVRRMTSSVPGASVSATVSVDGEVSGTMTLVTYVPGEPQTGLLAQSSPGDFILDGETLFARAPEWTLPLEQMEPLKYLRIWALGPGTHFLLDLRSRLGDTLQPGAYEDAARAAFATASPGLDLGYDHRGCNEVQGRFAVLEVDLEAEPPRLAVNFEQKCDGGPPLFGELRINSTVPYAFQVTGPDTEPDPMAFDPRSPVRPASRIVSNVTRVNGITEPVPIAIEGGEYSLNGQAFTSSPGTAANRDEIQVRMKSSPSPSGTRSAVLEVGGQVVPFDVETYGLGMMLTGLQFDSMPGDSIGQGLRRFYPMPPNIATLYGDASSLDFDLDGVGNARYRARFEPPEGAALEPGAYEEAGNSPGPGVAVIAVSGNGSGCSVNAGRFVIHELTFAGLDVERFSADFEHRCVGDPPMYGQLRFNSDVPFSTLLRVDAPQDASGEGADDLLWQHADGRVAVWLMNGTSPAGSAEILGPGTGWGVTQVADFDADGKSDLVWQHADGRMAIYLMDGTAATTTQQLLNAGSGWSVLHTPDLDADGKADLVFQHTDGSTAVWLMDGVAMTGGATVMGPGSGWSVTHAADFDADSKADLLWTHADGRVAVWLMDGAAVKGTNQILNAASGWSATRAADLSGDGMADIVWTHADGRVAVWRMDGDAMAQGAEILGAGIGWSVARSADFDGDGKADLYFVHADGRAALWLMDGLVPTRTGQLLNAASPWSLARTADLNADGRADIVWRHTDGSHAAWLMFGTSMASGAGILGAGSGWEVSGGAQ